MSIEYIEYIVNQISNLFQELEYQIEKNKLEKVEIDFPKGVIRTADFYRSRLTFISDEVLKTNIAYHLMLSDVYRWILNRFKIYLVAKEMLIKEGISLFGNILEAVLLHTAKLLKPDEEKIRFYRACTILVEEGIISKEMKKELEWVWSMRCKEHLASLPEREYGKYKLEDYNRTVLIWQSLEEKLRDAKQHGKI
jgi:hypothetical protein